VAMASQHSEVSHQRVQEQLRVWNGNQRLELTPTAAAPAPRPW